MAELRKPEKTLCLKSGAKKDVKIELFCAENWAKTEQEKKALSGLYRVRINGRWRNHEDGGRLYLTSVHISGLLLARLMGADAPVLPPMPNLPRGSRVSAPNGNTLAGQILRDVTWTETDPIQGFDGRWLVGVRIMGRGIVMMPVDDVTRITDKDKAARAERAAKRRISDDTQR